jgi:hypothetical protein
LSLDGSMWSNRQTCWFVAAQHLLGWFDIPSNKSRIGEVDMANTIEKAEDARLEFAMIAKK